MFGANQKEILEKMQQSLVVSKEKLAELKVTGEAGGGLVKIELDGNRKLASFQLNVDLKLIDKDDLEDFIAVALEKAIEKANFVNEQEMSRSASSFMPGF